MTTMELKPRQVKHGNKTSGSERTALHSIRATRIKQVQQGSGLRLADVITTKCIILLVFFVNFCLDYIGMYSYLQMLTPLFATHIDLSSLTWIRIYAWLFVTNWTRSCDISCRLASYT